MPKQTTDRNTTWSINQDNKTWTLVQSATITVDNQYGILDSGAGNQIKVLGDIVAKGAGSVAIRFFGSSSEVEIGENSVINAMQASFGIVADGAGSDITNRGIIKSDFEGIHGALWNNVKNFGAITADRGLFFAGDGAQVYNYGSINAEEEGIRAQADGTFILNAKGATIASDDTGIFLASNGESRVINRGLITADDYAVLSADNVMNLTNAGKIVGDVYMGSGDDRLDTRGGIINGRVIGGSEDDTYLVSAGNIKIVEEAGGGQYDRVLSTATITLRDEIEQLFLKGGKDIDGTGNASGNKIVGNAGDNTLQGLAGADNLSGGKGDDILRGGADGDLFNFATGFDVDRIKGFQDGTDRLAISGVTGQDEFDALNITDGASGVVINLGDGDKLIIEGLLKADLTWAGDFQFVV